MSKGWAVAVAAAAAISPAPVASPTRWSTRPCATAPRRRWSTNCSRRSASTPARPARPWRPACSRPPPSHPSPKAAVRDQGLHVERDRRLGGHRLGPYPRLQRSAEMAPGDRRIADRGQLAGGPRRLYPQFPAARRWHHSRAAAHPVGLRLPVHLLVPPIVVAGLHFN